MNRLPRVCAVIAGVFCTGGAARGDLFAVCNSNTNDQVSDVWRLDMAGGEGERCGE